VNKARNEIRILLVEDNPTNQEVAISMLECLGYDAVDVVADGPQALAALSANDFDLVLMDCHLPVMDGYETSRRIRAPESEVRNHDIPIVATTAAAMECDRQECLAAGMNAYLAKPLRLAALRQAIEAWASDSKGAAVPPPEVAVSSPTTAVAFDPAEFDESLMGNEVLERRVLGRFVDDMPGQLSLLAQAVSDGDAPRVRLVAHSIKGAAASVSGPEMREASWKLEQQGRDGDLASSADALRELSASFERAKPIMESFCRKGADD
jgi:two-component system sensor histidine kinase/response regulator